MLVLLVLLASSWLSLAAHDRITTKVTWDREIAPIVAGALCDVPLRLAAARRCR